MCRGRGLKPHAIGERSEVELCTLCCASFRMLASNCITRLCSSVSCASIKRKNKTQSHKEQPHDTSEELCHYWSDKHLPGKGGAELGKPSQGHLVPGDLICLKRNLQRFPESFKKTVKDFKEEVPLFNVNFCKITLNKAWKE